MTFSPAVKTLAPALLAALLGACGHPPASSPPMQESVPPDIAAAIAAREDLIRVSRPEPMTRVSSPLRVEGRARGSWYFEAVFPLVLTDWDGRILAQSHGIARLDPEDSDSTWMTEDFVPFSGALEFAPPPDTGPQSRRGWLILRKANASGLPGNDDALEIPVRFR